MCAFTSFIRRNREGDWGQRGGMGGGMEVRLLVGFVALVAAFPSSLTLVVYSRRKDRGV